MSRAVIYLKKDLNISELKVDIVLGVFNFCSLFGSLPEEESATGSAVDTP